MICRLTTCAKMQIWSRELVYRNPRALTSQWDGGAESRISHFECPQAFAEGELDRRR